MAFIIKYDIIYLYGVIIMDLHESGEMYLETILRLQNDNIDVRSIDIANYMHFSKPSVSRAIKLLKESKLIVVDQKGYIDFTDAGREIAVNIYSRHQILTELMIYMGVSKKQAEEDACRFEHVISDETYHCVKKFMAEVAKNN